MASTFVQFFYGGKLDFKGIEIYILTMFVHSLRE